MAEPPKTTGQAASPGGAGEPSMEEILASIRRILSEDESTQGAPAPAPDPTAAATRPDDGVLQLTEEMLAERGASPSPPPAAGIAPAPPAAPPAPSAAPEPLAVAPPAYQPLSFAAPPPPAAGVPEGLLDAGAAAAAAAALGQLTRGAAPERPPVPGAWPLGAAGLSVEDIVRQELRPLLSAWLNANLPRIVQEAVAREMERVRARIG
jgi:hypothetical protein